MASNVAEAKSGNGARQRRVAAPKTERRERGLGRGRRGAAKELAGAARDLHWAMFTQSVRRRWVYLRRESQLSI